MTWPNLDANHLIVSSSQMKGIEEKLFSYGMPVEALMEKVGLEMKKWFIENPRLLENGVVVLVGPGHNGGDGLVLARELHLLGVEVFLWCPFVNKKSLTVRQLSYCYSIGIKELQSPPDPAGNFLWIDALFGLGQNRPLPQEIGFLLQSRERVKPGKLISLDVPAGICSDTGKSFDAGVATALFTLTVGLIKSGLIQDIALRYVGTLVRVDIGIPEIAFELLPASVPLRIYSKDIDSFLLPRTLPNATKYLRGRVAVIAGSDQFKGASLLALQGVIASGVGSVQAVLPKDIVKSIFAQVPEVVFYNYSNDSNEQSIFIHNCLKEINLDRIDSLLIGPGLGGADEQWSDFSPMLEDFIGLLVLDADALNRLALSQEGWKWLPRRKGPTWITPHLNEFRRLFPDIAISSPLEAAVLAARISGAGILLKGANSVIATPNGLAWQLVDTSPYVARTGLGDVLAGFTAGFGALGVCSEGKLDFDLFAFAVLLHSHAAKNCNEGTNASSISRFLGKLVKTIQMQNVQADTL
ncbi:NAD(P)H-hydrate dehydratase [Prochlorococcus marinus]|uniref:NAD(P)H-hydrate dehydratase n=1 Tax=Prochlorococcus marinus TaxID=1219 RepID=UPI0022B574ED|nr:NAD(P)H-hydrate dehydratase [Prochlorococcus marinus]